VNLNGARIRVGVLLNSLELPAWQFAALESIVKSDCADLALIALRQGSAPVRGIVHRAFLRLEDRNRRPQPDACAAVSILPLVQFVDRVGYPGPDASHTEHAWLQSIRAGELDVLLVFADAASLPAGASLARWGHWHYACDGRPFAPADGSMVGFISLIRRRSFLSTSIQIHQPGNPVIRTAYRTRSAIDYHSHYVTRNEHLWKCSTFVLRALRKCREAGGTEYLKSLPSAPSSDKQPGISPIRVVAGAMMLSAFFAYFMWRAWRKLYRRLFVERWVLMFGMDERTPRAGRFRKLLPPAGRFWADPHVIEDGGCHHVFFEDASCGSGIGHIALLSDNGNGDFTPPKAVLRKPYHLSYPFVFQWREDWYLLPESAANRTVELYRCIRFPDEWEFQHNLLEDVEAYDSTLVEHGGRWWLFANIREHPGASSWDELHVFHSDSPVCRSWQAHRENPVLSDVTCARPAGRLFAENGRLFRPSQNSSGRYGRALQFNEVIELSERRYAERAVETIEPTWSRSVRGVHSYSRAGRMTVVDAMLCERRSSAKYQKHRPYQA
jgi:hypothetical protein